MYTYRDSKYKIIQDIYPHSDLILNFFDIAGPSDVRVNIAMRLGHFYFIVL